MRGLLSSSAGTRSLREGLGRRNVFSANPIKAGYLSGQIMGRDGAAPKKKLKVKPAVAEIELQRVNNVKSKSSLTAIKHFSTSFPFAPLVQQKCCVQTSVVLLDGEIFLSQHEAKAPSGVRTEGHRFNVKALHALL